MSRAAGSLTTTVSMLVPIRIAELQQQGGPTDRDLQEAVGSVTEIATTAEGLLCGEEGHGALLDKIINGIAVLAFMPGGVDLFGSHWEANHA